MISVPSGSSGEATVNHRYGPCGEIGLLLEAQDAGVKPERFFLIVHVDGSPFDLHCISLPYSNREFLPQYKSLCPSSLKSTPRSLAHALKLEVGRPAAVGATLQIMPSLTAV